MLPMKNLPRVVLAIGGHELNAYVARGAKERALGLMHCRNLQPDEGMLFVSGEPQEQSFWMKDTPLPLSIAFIDTDGTLLQIEDMAPHSLEATESEAPVRYVLEVPQGWFADRRIRAGDRVTGPVFLGGDAEGDAEPRSLAA
jgi:uncharacterized protein